MSKSKKPATPEHEKIAAANAQKMLNYGKNIQGQVMPGFMDSISRETGHREAGNASADISSLAAEQLKQIQGNPLAVAEHGSKQSMQMQSGTLSALNTAAVSDTSRRVNGAKFGMDMQGRTMDSQRNLADIANKAEMERFNQKVEQRSQLLNAGGVALAGGLNAAGFNQEQGGLLSEGGALRNLFTPPAQATGGPTRRYANGRKR